MMDVRTASSQALTGALGSAPDNREDGLRPASSLDLHLFGLAPHIPRRDGAHARHWSPSPLPAHGGRRARPTGTPRWSQSPITASTDLVMAASATLPCTTPQPMWIGEPSGSRSGRSGASSSTSRFAASAKSIAHSAASGNLPSSQTANIASPA